MSEKKQLKIIATKVPEDSYNLLKSLCDRNGINAYTLIQWMANVFVRFSDDMHNLDDRLCKAIRLFEDPSVWGDSFNIFLMQTPSSKEQSISQRARTAAMQAASS